MINGKFNIIDYEIYKRVTNKIENDRGQSCNISLKKGLMREFYPILIYFAMD